MRPVARRMAGRLAARAEIVTKNEVTALRRQIDALTVEVQQLYQQAERLPLLYTALTPSVPLPPTRGWAVSPDALVELMLAVFAGRPQTIVELGSGTSSVVLGLAARKVGGGRVHSFDHDADYAELTRRRLADHGLDEVVTVTTTPIGPLDDASLSFDGGPELWYSGVTLPDEIDLLFVDGPVGDMAPCVRYPALAAAAPRLRPGARILLDDADRPDEIELVERWLARWPQLSRGSEAETEKGLATLVWQP